MFIPDGFSDGKKSCFGKLGKIDINKNNDLADILRGICQHNWSFSPVLNTTDTRVTTQERNEMQDFLLYIITTLLTFSVVDKSYSPLEFLFLILRNILCTLQLVHYHS